MIIWALAKKELRLLLRDRMAVVVLLGMPLIFILLLGLLLGENFGQKNQDEKLRVVLVDEDQGEVPIETTAGIGLLADPTGQGPLLAASAACAASQVGARAVGQDTWAKVVQRDLADTTGIRVEVLPSLPEAERLIRKHKQAAVLVFEPGFSQQVDQCSFLVGGINPFHRDGVYLNRIHARLLKDSKQPGAAAIIEQVAQVSLLRVILPWMIGRAFERLSDPDFIEILGKEVKLPGFTGGTVSLGDLLTTASFGNPTVAQGYRQKVGKGVQSALKEQFKKYELTGKTWATLTRSTEETAGQGPAEGASEGGGLFSRGAQRYQVLVPSYTVMFAFFLVMTVGWVFVAERRQGTLKRLRAAPVTRGEILVGKLLPCFALSLGQGVFLLLAGKLIFGMRWGPDDWPLWQQIACLFPVVFCTSIASMGLALLVAAVARSEMQVALYGTVPVLVMALIGGCILPREMMPESTQYLSLLVPHGWALDAYRELLDVDPHSAPDLTVVAQSCGVLTGFGATFLGLAWCLLRLD